MTDKATVEMTAPVAGKIVSIHGEPGDMAAVGATWSEAEVQAAMQGVPAPISVPRSAAPPSHAVAKSQRREPTVREHGPAQASPAVRARAQKLGIDLSQVRGTGEGGRITHDDLDAVLVPATGARRTSTALAERNGIEPVKVIGLRRKIAEKMADAKRRIPHYAYVEECDLTELEELRAHLNVTKRNDQPKLTLLPFLMRALVLCLPDFPQINARFDDEQGVVYRHENVDIGIATQTDNGLIVPVVRHAEARDVWDSAVEVARLANAVRNNTATKDELSGSTITITSLGALGGIVTTPVINHPEVAIIGVNKLVERPAVKNGQIVIRKMMNLSSSFDHRVVDGYDAAAFIQRVKGMLEHPAALFIER
jgi:2-oxoisovalerate dehydrogenase E2 component (dihydrolipoyl transacylase)